MLLLSLGGVSGSSYGSLGSTASLTEETASNPLTPITEQTPPGSVEATKQVEDSAVTRKEIATNTDANTTTTTNNIDVNNVNNADVSSIAPSVDNTAVVENSTLPQPETAATNNAVPAVIEYKPVMTSSEASNALGSLIPGAVESVPLGEVLPPSSSPSVASLESAAMAAAKSGMCSVQKQNLQVCFQKYFEAQIKR